MQYQIINLETGDFQVVTLEEAAEIAQLDPHDIEWAIEEHGVCETDIHQITKLPGVPDDEEERDASDDGDGDSIIALPVFVYISQAEFEAHLAQHPAAVIRLSWHEPIVREAVEADKAKIMAQLRGDEGEAVAGKQPAEPSGVFHLTREEIALIL
jgi:hypothetical protein